MYSDFRNESYTDFSIPARRREMEEWLERIQAGPGEEYPVIIGSEKLTAGEKFPSCNPSKKGEVVGLFQRSPVEFAQKAIEIAASTFEQWRWTPPGERAAYLFKAASVMRRRRAELAAWMVLEVGKNWMEADADVAEAIDFLEFYGREMIRLSQPVPLTPYPSEVNELKYIPLGVGVVIAPWNFPLAILVGMTSATFVAGNTVVMKPSSDSPLMGAKFMEILEEVGLPPGVVNYITGGGGEIGDSLVSHPMTRLISFTGSKEVGLHIVELAAKTVPGQKWIKRVIAEMGGKDAIIVDSESDVGEAVKGVAASAFGYQGQKCSACSRAIVLEDVYNEFLDRLVTETEKIKMGPVIEPDNFLGPVINAAAEEKILKYIEIGKREGRLVTGGKRGDASGYFIEPTIFADVEPKAVIAREEIFGPVLAVIKASDFDHALQIANDSEYGLTGSVYTRNREKIRKAKQIFHVGNLYFNRKCTGALVGVHPFGGFNMSGTDSKAGGRDYLLLYTQAKSISEQI
ncbi:MAG: L-glutamate gamma-semialdehyde dehydrogenase [Fidelibacterota bacterium]